MFTTVTKLRLAMARKIMYLFKKWQGKCRTNRVERHLQQSRKCLNFIGSIMHDTHEQQIKHKVFFPFLLSTVGYKDLIAKIVSVAKSLRYMRERFVLQLIKNKIKTTEIMNYWWKEERLMFSEMNRDAKTKWAQKQCANYVPPSEKLSKYCVQRYFERVKFKYVLAFLQWRSKNPRASYDDLEDLFN
jgi:hypothetical protein